MKKLDFIFKIFIIAFMTVLLAVGFLQKEEEPVKASGLGDMVCDAIIPVGEAAEEVKAIMDIVYKAYRGSVKDMISSSGYLTELIALISENNEVCDFEKCKPRVDDIGPDLKLKYNALVKSGEIVGAHLPLCIKDGGVGEPCPVIDDHVLASFINLQSVLHGAGANIHDLFSKKTEFVTEETKHPGEIPYVTKITRLEAVQRKLELVDKWLTPSVGTQHSCVLSTVDKKRALAGKIGDVFPIQCAIALEQGHYWPEAWSEVCIDECNDGADEDCVECLAKCEGKSVLAQINCILYNKTEVGNCGSVCSGSLNDECFECLCTDGQGHALSRENCIEWLCGGSYYNWVCCHETSLEK